MKVLFINSVCGIGSTGKICVSLARELERQGHTCKIAYGRVDDVPQEARRFAVKIGNSFDRVNHMIGTRLFDKHGFYSTKATEHFLAWADEFDPDMVWLHNLHGYYINISKLFTWVKSREWMQIRWTLHDCWPFTGHCAYFTMINCQQWQTHCDVCLQTKRYPSSWQKSNCSYNYARKKEVFCGVKNMTIITPSQWLADLVKESFLRDYSVRVEYNQINTEVFRPTASDFRKKHGLENKKIILGVASYWDKRKGLEDFIKLSKIIGVNTKIVLVGLSKTQIRKMPKQICAITQINSARELAEIYTAADVLFNPTYEDNYPTVNLEAEACGTRVITYRTGGTPETLHKVDSCVIDVGNYQKVLEMI